MKHKVWFVASDHAGFSLKQHMLQTVLKDLPHKDLGTDRQDSVDYPDFADRVAEHIKAEPDSFGLLICGSGQGMAIRANRYPHIRAALCCNEEWAKLAREHNDANVLCLGGRMTEFSDAEKIFATFLGTAFAGGRHQKRVEKL